ncbi:hypothetical protein C0J52_19294 [Blattella germanica]|nr:hypothetical protein C0J52_19294 [Blattella germanica]
MTSIVLTSIVFTLSIPGHGASSMSFLPSRNYLCVSKTCVSPYLVIFRLAVVFPMFVIFVMKNTNCN